MNRFFRHCFNSFLQTFSQEKAACFFLALNVTASLCSYAKSTPVQQLKDNARADSIPQTNTTVFIADSSKMFASLLENPAGSNNPMDFLMNAEAKYFADGYIKKHTAYFNNMKVWGKPYFDLYDRILSSYGIPVQLKYLSVIESSLNCTAVSWAGAVGPWQIMEATARENGLRTGYFDDRADYIKSTNAACRILKDLYNTYGDWLLVVAAYNTGAGNVNRAIAKAHSKDFWKIQYYLPLETRNHVKKFIATHYFFEGNGSFATGNNAANVLQNKEASLDVAGNSSAVSIYGKYNSVVIANNLMMDLSLFNQLNPDIDNVLAKGDIYSMRLPADKAQLFQDKKSDILKQSVEWLLNGYKPNAATVVAGK
ncbi:lytic transglycosylase domain-containing protein [Parafilimonas sp.]|uniref:lytic transglycosylase domain-containing protein n=1 Tax=Parafilimonas sp. TaxID=1969739 RepID=UPI0039E2E8DE